MNSASKIDAATTPRHLWIRCNNRLPCFLEDQDRHVYLTYLGESLESSNTDLHAFVLMTNHVHLLATGQEADSVSRFMQQLNRRYSRYFNKAHDRTGTLYEGRYQSRLVETDSHFLGEMRYIERNPVKAGMVQHPGDYPWSSYWQNASGEPGGLLTPHSVYQELGSSPEARGLAYRRLFELPDEDRKLEVIRLEKVI